ncbi:MAG: hypothetical protein LUG60_08290 [Erysipelotrichaceae bacterium]|nr:hypothetical protein [Erysipelotrichaceae bacterium]
MISAIVHDIAYPLCREKYGNTNGNYQKAVGLALTKAFFDDFNLKICIKKNR